MYGRIWTTEETDFVKDHMEKMTKREMGKALGRTIGSVLNRMRELKRLGFERSEAAIKELEVKGRRKGGRETQKKIRFRRIPCQYPELGNCWVCISCSPTYNGYPRVCRNGKQQKLSRYVWEKYFGPIPKGMFVLHKCDNRACINPEHLFLGTHKDNMQDMMKKRWMERWKKEKKSLHLKKRDAHAY
ncbi:hypothetical protein LCGC14_1568160 [marine sediment metagenome]|uniref:HNH nuclease domain-containing protein n=1 Tax=marine sediment metagenome TaxID=412755 RepID=A0A0F9IKG4_9ZZZZ